MRLLAVTVILAMTGFAAAAQGGVLNHYSRAYYAAKGRCSDSRAPGRNVRRDGLSAHRKATRADYRRSTLRLEGMCRPLMRVVTATPAVAASVSQGGGGGLVACIIRSESGGNPQATNSSGHMGLGQWDQATWEADGGTRYAPTPLGASAEQQHSIIAEQVGKGNTGQWTNYDPC